MSVEFDVEGVCGACVDRLDFWEEKEESKSNYSQMIFAPPFYPVAFSKQSVLNFHSQESKKAMELVSRQFDGRITRSNDDRDREAHMSGEARATLSWGNGDPKLTFEGVLTIEDSHGNYVKLEANQNSDGTGDVSASAGVN